MPPYGRPRADRKKLRSPGKRKFAIPAAPEENRPRSRTPRVYRSAWARTMLPTDRLALPYRAPSKSVLVNANQIPKTQRSVRVTPQGSKPSMRRPHRKPNSVPVGIDRDYLRLLQRRVDAMDILVVVEFGEESGDLFARSFIE